MTRKSRTLHDIGLEHLIGQLETVGESRHDMHYIISEGIWYKPNDIDYHSLCDLILVYRSDAVAVEYKTSHHGRHKAIHQIEAGKEFIQKELMLPYRHGKFVWSENEHYKFEVIQ